MKVILNDFSAGLDKEVRSIRTNTYYDAGGFDTQSQKTKLIPFGETEAEALTSGDITDKRFASMVRDSNGNLIAIGRNGSGSPTVNDLFAKDSATNIASTWTAFTSDSGVGVFFPNSLVFYRSATYYIATTGRVVRKYDGSWSTVGAMDFATSWANMLIPKPIIHPQDDILYFGMGQNMAKINNVTYADITSVTVPTTQYISDFADYDNFLAIATAPTLTGNNSRVYLWDRDTSKTTFQSNIDWGEGSLMILENLGGTLVGVSITDANYLSGTFYTTNKVKKLTISYLSGNQVFPVQEFIVDSTFSLKNFKSRIGNKVYFSGDYATSLYCVEKKKDGSIVVSKDKFLNNGTSITTLKGLYILGDYLFTMFDTAGTSGNVRRTKVTSSYTDTSYLTTTINPSMNIYDRSKKKTLKSVTLTMSPLIAGASATVEYSVDGGAYVEILTEATDGKIATQTTRETTGKNLLPGTEYQFKIKSTGGAEIVSLEYEYEVNNTIG